MSRTIRDLTHGKTLRTPKTFPEHRDSEACRVDGLAKRAKRNKRNLPSAWEDKVIAATYEQVPRKYPCVSEYFMFW